MRNKRWIDKMNKKGTGRRIGGILTAVLLAASLMMAVPAAASEDPTGEPSATPAASTGETTETTVTPTAKGNEILPVADAPESNNLTVQFAYHPSNEISVGIGGAEFTIVKVADLDVKRQVAIYTPVSGFTSVASYEGMTTEQSITAASSLATEYNNNPSLATVTAKGTTVMTTDGTNSSVSFEGLSPGIYLVSETGRSDVAENFTIAPPFLVQVPMYQKNEAGDEYVWLSDVVVSPKTTSTIIPPTTTPQNVTTTPRRSVNTVTPTTTKPPTKKATTTPKKTTTTRTTRRTTTNRTTTVKTGDRQPIVFWFGIACLAFSIILIVVSRKRKRA